MKISSARFIKSAVYPKDFVPGGLPEIVFAGRSNVGKSSLLNRLMRQDLAKTSKSPGKTRMINFFRVNDRFHLVDLPGYGFAKVSHKLQEVWGKMITDYILTRRELRLAVHLIDSRHPPTPNDHELLELLGDAHIPVLLVATKFDKLNRAEKDASTRIIREAFELDSETVIIPVSSETGLGIPQMWQVIELCLDQPREL